MDEKRKQDTLRTAQFVQRVNHRKDCMGLMLGAEDFRLRQKQDDQRIRETHDTDPHSSVIRLPRERNDFGVESEPWKNRVRG